MPSRPGRIGGVLKRLALAGLGLAVLAFLAIQTVPPRLNNPPVLSEPNWDSPETLALAERACFDCHSNQTEWPWYAHVAPASWLVAHDVYEGRSELNFSEWYEVNDEGKRPGEMAEEIDEGDMPPPRYVLMHPEAKLTREESRALAEGLDATLERSR